MWAIYSIWRQEGKNAELCCGYMYFKGQKIYEIIIKCLFFIHKNIHRNGVKNITKTNKKTNMGLDGLFGWIKYKHVRIVYYRMIWKKKYYP